MREHTEREREAWRREIKSYEGKRKGSGQVRVPNCPPLRVMTEIPKPPPRRAKRG
jgi:hypothetical protein